MLGPLSILLLPTFPNSLHMKEEGVREGQKVEKEATQLLLQRGPYTDPSVFPPVPGITVVVGRKEFERNHLREAFEAGLKFGTTMVSKAESELQE